jgi:serralysin
LALFNHVGTITSGVTHLSFIRGMSVKFLNGVGYLYTASQSDGGLNVFSLSQGASATFVDQIGASAARGTNNVTHIERVTVGSSEILIPSGERDDKLAFHKIDTDGSLNGIKQLAASSALIGGIQNTATMLIEGKTYMVASQLGQSGFQSFRIRDDLSIEHKNHVDDTAGTFLADVSSIATLEFAGRQFFIVASASENAVSNFWMGKWGNIKARASIEANGEFSIATPTVLETSVVDGRAYVIVGAAESSSITVLRANQWGGLFLEDTLLDTVSTRFSDISVLTSVQVEGRTLLLAGGRDDGITMTELLPDGTMFVRGSVADQLDTSLQNILELEAAIVGTEIQLFATSEQAGITQFTLDPGDLGAIVSGDDDDNTLDGTVQDDLLVGYDGNDTLNGNAGNDLLLDGAGVDILNGGDGADVFRFKPDTRMDTVQDFEVGVDKLDLSEFFQLNNFDQLDFIQKAYGVLIEFDGDRFRIEQDAGTLLLTI